MKLREYWSISHLAKVSYNFLRVLQEPKRDTKGVYQGAESLVRAENSFPSHISLPSSYLPLLFIPPLPVLPSHSHPSPGARTKFFPGEGHRRRKGSVVGGHHGEFGGLGGRASSGVQRQSSWSEGEAPLKLKAFWSLDVQQSRQI